MLLLERIERQTLADRQALLARGVTDGLPDPWTEQQRLDERLVFEPEPLTAVASDQLELRRALGVA